MREILFVILFFSNPYCLKRYWKSGEGVLFSQYLMKKEIEYEVYVRPSAGVGVHDTSLQNRVHPLTIEEVKLRIQQELQSKEVVFLISDVKEAIAALAWKKGCLPFLLSGKEKRKFKSNTHIEIGSLSALNVYFQESFPFHLLTILSRLSGGYQKRIKNRKERIAEQIRARGGAFIFGSGTIGKQVHDQGRRAGLKIFGFVDNNICKQRYRLFNLPVIGPSALNPARDVVILASGNYSYDIFQQLRGLGFKYIQNLSEFLLSVPSSSQPETQYFESLQNHAVAYQDLYLRLADKQWRNVLENLIEFRKTFDLLPLSRICDKTSPQWFATELFVPSAKHVFADGGAFDGDTALRFIHENGDSYKAIHFFEADPSIAQRAKRNLKGYKDVHVHNVGVSSQKGRLSFSRTGLTDGHLVEDDGLPVKIDSLDNVVRENITFLKLDVEGAEKNAITGARGHIANNSPMLGIAVYHRACDLWSIPGQLLRINPNYSFYLRHYTQVAYETVLYGSAK